MSDRLLVASSKDRMNAHARTHRLVVRVDDVAHEIIKLDGNTLSVTFACEPGLATLVDPDTIVYEHGEVDIDCMSCLVKRPVVTDRVRYEGVIHWGRCMIIGIDWVQGGGSTHEPFVRFLCTKPIHPAKSVEFVRAVVDCMSCLVARARKEE